MSEGVLSDYIIDWREFFCGWGAAIINVTLTYPINKLIFRQILHGTQIIPAFLQLKNEGFYYLYRGILPPMCQKTLSMSLMFGIYEEVRRPLVQLGFNPYTAKTIGALTSGTTEAILMPFERVQTILADSKHHIEYKNTIHVFKELKKYGIREYYRGLVPILLRNGPSNVGFFIIREEFQSRFPKYENHLLRTSCEFICGAMIGVVLSTVFYPLNVLKIHMQTKVGGKFDNPFKVLVEIYKERGGKIRYLYYGVQMNYTRAFISWGIMNTAYEHIKNFVY
ncbi:mitochondrial nicotinamide adenine dinucleotide transporter SLC25A51 [Diorhabda carinulata]|uniref:mitochondrial nicotinamide adenine dinucleotide transporter SLC25A51 n=1 Tax=Diorhabda sublineata TaxID=1163346 RepID=UPI0024E06D46|nr:mitochondrial nicotinamide adenine dinucleotide transporter SLC25A51 [Diorhabda sublineata]XP_057672857.1 mitochondrial nicotinamide adenine dinucleotide transporter SLC25A51 [Diorhabda carinulata]XP_057672858.1 mitochondrial nicotinamide adenine dinucleotide transporter SLC25A51 [Diorhabda carinulata]